MLSVRRKWPYRLRAVYFVTLGYWWQRKRRSTLERATKHTYKGVNLTSLIVTPSDDEENRLEFVYRLVGDALRLVERYDARRFRRIQREVRFVNVGRLAPYEGGMTYGMYFRYPREIIINYERFYDAPTRGYAYDWHVARCACYLIHEATHGAIDSRYVPYFGELDLRPVAYVADTTKRIERLCRWEEQRFAARLGRYSCELRVQHAPGPVPRRGVPDGGLDRRTRELFVIKEPL